MAKEDAPTIGAPPKGYAFGPTLTALSIAGLIGLGLAIWADQEIHDKKPLVALVGAIAILVVSERLSSTIKETQDDKVVQRLETVTERLRTAVVDIPPMVAHGGHLVQFSSSLLAIEHIRENGRPATVVRNTVLRFGKSFDESSIVVGKS